MSLMPVPELPRSILLSDEVKGISLRFMFTVVLLIRMEDPIAFNAFIVEIGSSPFKKPSIVIFSLINEPIMTAL
jgi:hypothetical protein